MVANVTCASASTAQRRSYKSRRPQRHWSRQAMATSRRLVASDCVAAVAPAGSLWKPVFRQPSLLVAASSRPPPCIAASTGGFAVIAARAIRALLGACAAWGLAAVDRGHAGRGRCWADVICLFQKNLMRFA